jgi:hypothetical protein
MEPWVVGWITMVVLAEILATVYTNHAAHRQIRSVKHDPRAWVRAQTFGPTAVLWTFRTHTVIVLGLVLWSLFDAVHDPWEWWLFGGLLIWVTVVQRFLIAVSYRRTRAVGPTLGDPGRGDDK